MNPRLLLRLTDGGGDPIAVVPEQRADAQQLVAVGFATTLDGVHYSLTEDAAARILDLYPAPPMVGPYPDEEDDAGLLVAVEEVLAEMTRERSDPA